MIQTIPLGRVLQETVATPYRDLVTRPTGAAVRGYIQKAIAGSEAPTTMLDFTEVGLLDFSCADEIVAKLLLDSDPGIDRYVMLLGTREDHTEAIDHVLNNHALAIAVVTSPDEPPQLLGRVTPELQRVFHCVFRLGPGDAGSIADMLGWTLERAADALLTLSLLRLLRVKDPDDVLKWNNRLRDMRLSDMSLQAQQYLEEYIPKFVPNHRPVYVWFDVYDLEEKRL